MFEEPSTSFFTVNEWASTLMMETTGPSETSVPIYHRQCHRNHNTSIMFTYVYGLVVYLTTLSVAHTVCRRMFGK
jgi:hypothetical protein